MGATGKRDRRGAESVPAEGQRKDAILTVIAASDKIRFPPAAWTSDGGTAKIGPT
jgi:hypothetical protein